MPCSSWSSRTSSSSMCHTPISKKSVTITASSESKFGSYAGWCAVSCMVIRTWLSPWPCSLLFPNQLSVGQSTGQRGHTGSVFSYPVGAGIAIYQYHQPTGGQWWQEADSDSISQKGSCKDSLLPQPHPLLQITTLNTRAPPILMLPPLQERLIRLPFTSARTFLTEVAGHSIKHRKKSFAVFWVARIWFCL